MKKPFLIFALCSLLFASGIALFAQTTTGDSIIIKMKAAIHNFTLAGELNPGETGLQSSPLSGKKTGDMLTAGEYNRILELIGQGGGGSGWLDCTEVVNNAGKTPAIAVCPADKKVVSGGCSGFVPAANPIARIATNDFYCSNTSADQWGIAYAVCCSVGSGGGTGSGGTTNSCYRKTVTNLTPRPGGPAGSIDYSCNNANDYISSVACTSNEWLSENTSWLWSVSCRTIGGGNLSAQTNTKVDMVCCSL